MCWVVYWRYIVYLWLLIVSVGFFFVFVSPPLFSYALLLAHPAAYISPFLSNRSWVRYSVTNKADALMGNMSLLCSSARPSWGFISFLACFSFFLFFVCSCVAIDFPGEPERLQLSQASTWLVDGRLLNINVPMPIARPDRESWEVTFNPREILFHLMVSLSESKKGHVFRTLKESFLISCGVADFF